MATRKSPRDSRVPDTWDGLIDNVLREQQERQARRDTKPANQAANGNAPIMGGPAVGGKGPDASAKVDKIAFDQKTKAIQPKPATDCAVAKTDNKKKSVEKTAASAEDKWTQVWNLLKSGPEMTAKGSGNFEACKNLLGKIMSLTAPLVLNGPVCANPRCGKFGHTLAVCPVPTTQGKNGHGMMAGCFFCNVIDHNVDDCPMMEWVTPAALVTHLITNRAGLPPWNTRIDWVALAIDNWDLVCFTSLPLTRDFLDKVYTPGRLWQDIERGPSPYTDPLFVKASRNLLKSLAANNQHSADNKDDKGEKPPRPPLMEASNTLCYCRYTCTHHHQLQTAKGTAERAVFRNDRLQKYIPNAADKAEYDRLVAEYERALAATQAQLAKKMPKKVTKEHMGRRAMKKAAAAAAAAEKDEEEEKRKKKTEEKKEGGGGTQGQAGVEEKTAADGEGEIAAASDRLLDMADRICGVFEKLQEIVKS